MDKAFYKELFDRLQDSVYVIDPVSSNITYCNRAGYESLQLEADEVLNHSVLTFEQDIKGLAAWEDIANTIREVDDYTFVGRHIRKDGSIFPVEVNTTLWRHNNKEYFVSIARDITRRSLHQQELKKYEQRLWYVLNETNFGLWSWNINTNEVYFSPRLKQMLGYGPDELKPDLSTWVDNIHAEDRPLIMRLISDHIEGKRERFEAEYRFKNRNGHYLWVHEDGKVTDYDDQNQPQRMVGMVQNITDRKNMEINLQDNASRDMLTGVLNRREGDRTLERQIQLSSCHNFKLGICLFDLDHFKQINDQYGHLKGDEVLKAVVEIVLENIRKTDFLYRWGGEEFIVIFPDITSNSLSMMAEKIRSAIENAPWKSNHNIRGITASFGIAEYQGNGHSFLDLILNADSAMYKAKSTGRNCVVFAT